MAPRRSTVPALLERLWYTRSPFVRVLWPIGFLTGLAATLRRRLYATAVLGSRRVGVPVIVVGNITVGGTGKTPITTWLARRLGDRGLRVGVICCGYGGRARTWPQPVRADSEPALVGDEAVLLAQQAGGPVVAGRDRVAAAERLLELGPVDVILCDDGLQHYRLQRDVEIAVVDGTRGLGNGMCLPAGPLREPARRLADVDAILVNDGSWGGSDAIRCDTVPVSARNLASGREAELACFRGRRAHALAAIGNPERFFCALEREGIRILRHPLPDHATIDSASFRFDDDLPVLVTEKDAVKCGRLAAGNVWSVAAEIRFRDGGDERLLQQLTGAIGWQEHR